LPGEPPPFPHTSTFLEALPPVVDWGATADFQWHHEKVSNLHSKELAMAGLKDLLKSDLAKGVAIGLGVAAAGVMLTPALRPMTRAALKSGILLVEKGREWMAEASEQLEDMVAEVRAELAEDRMETDDIAGVAEEVEDVAEGTVEAQA
jgi:hypothetical protein